MTMADPPPAVNESTPIMVNGGHRTYKGEALEMYVHAHICTILGCGEENSVKGT